MILVMPVLGARKAQESISIVDGWTARACLDLDTFLINERRRLIIALLEAFRRDANLNDLKRQDGRLLLLP